MVILQKSPHFTHNGEVFDLYWTKLLKPDTGTGIEFMVTVGTATFGLGYRHRRRKNTKYKSAANNMCQHEGQLSRLTKLL
jgi:hypothetical protein